MFNLGSSYFHVALTTVRHLLNVRVKYDTRCYFNVHSKADVSQLNLPHGNCRNKCAFGFRRNVSNDVADTTSSGRPFQILGHAVVANGRAATVAGCDSGTADCCILMPLVVVVGVVVVVPRVGSGAL